MYFFHILFLLLFSYFTENRQERLKRETTSKTSQEDMLLVQSIKITDKFGFEKQQQSKPKGINTSETVFMSTDGQGFCVNAIGEFRSISFSSFIYILVLETFFL